MSIYVGDITNPGKVLAPDDSLRRAADLLADAPGDAVAVAEGSRIIGFVTSRSIASQVPVYSPEEGRDLPVSRAIITNPISVPANMPVVDAVKLVRETGAPAVVVTNPYGGYHGIVGCTELLNALWGSLKMPPIAGMATPLGVHLTTGNHRAGPGNIALFLTGIMMGLLFYIATGTVELLALGLEKAGVPIQALLTSPPTGTLSLLDLVPIIQVLLGVMIFLVLVRLSPLSGYHAAEHQVVHAIEEHQDLVPHKIRQMPRPHQRCGTNLMVMVGFSLGILAIWNPVSQLLGGAGQGLLIMLVLLLVMSWRRIGWLLQQHFTTSRASDNQIQSGIKAGTELIEKYRMDPGRHADIRIRFWNAGFLQVMTGLLSVAGIGQLLLRWLP